MQELPASYLLRVAVERRAAEAREAAVSRLARPGRPVRRAVGLALVQLGERLAAESPLQPAGSR